MKVHGRDAWRAAGILAGAMILMAGLSACEDVIQGSAIVVTPDTSTLIGADATVLLTAAPPADGVSNSNQVDALFLPLVWTVGNPGMGRITSSGGYSAVYVSSGQVGQNNVTVSDQSGAVGVAVINQIEEEEEEEETEGTVVI